MTGPWGFSQGGLLQEVALQVKYLTDSGCRESETDHSPSTPLRLSPIILLLQVLIPSRVASEIPDAWLNLNFR